MKPKKGNQRVLDIVADAALNFRQNIGTLPQRPIKTYADMKTIFGGPVPENEQESVVHID